MTKQLYSFLVGLVGMLVVLVVGWGVSIALQPSVQSPPPPTAELSEKPEPVSKPVETTVAAVKEKPAPIRESAQPVETADDDISLGPEMLKVTTFKDGYKPSNKWKPPEQNFDWIWEVGKSHGSLSNTSEGLKMVCQSRDSKTPIYVPHLVYSPVSLVKGKTYRIEMELRSETANKATILVDAWIPKWHQFGSKRWPLEKDWKTYQFQFVANETCDKTVLNFHEFEVGGVYEIRRASMREVLPEASTQQNKPSAIPNDHAWLANFLAANRGLTESVATWENDRIVKLDVTRKGLTGTLDVSPLAELRELYCNGNKLRTLEVSGCTALQDLQCCDNALEKLDIRHNAALFHLDCHGNPWQHPLDVTGTPLVALVSMEPTGMTEWPWKRYIQKREGQRNLFLQVNKNVTVLPTASQTTTYADIFEAAQNGTVDDVRSFVARGVNLNAKNKDGDTALCVAALRRDDVGILKYLASQAPNINVKGNRDFTALHNALRHCDLETLKYLLSRGADIHAKNDTSDTPLHVASAWSSADVVKHLVSLGANIRAKNRFGHTPLHCAAMTNADSEVLKALLSLGADLNVKNNEGKTPLDVANTEEKKAILRAAAAPKVSKYADIDEAAQSGTVDDVRYFIDKGVDVNARCGDHGHWTPLLRASRHNSDVEVLKYLVSQGADVNARDGNGGGILNAANKNTLEVVKYLVSQGADVNAKCKNGFTPLHHAAMNNPDVEVVKYLISQGADVRAKMAPDFGSKTPLDAANTEEKRAILRAAMAGNNSTPFAKPEKLRFTLEVSEKGQVKLRVEKTDGRRIPAFNGKTVVLSGCPKLDVKTRPDGISRVVYDCRSPLPTALLFDFRKIGAWKIVEAVSTRMTLNDQAGKLTMRPNSVPLPNENTDGWCVFALNEIMRLPMKISFDATVTHRGECCNIEMCFPESILICQVYSRGEKIEDDLEVICRIGDAPLSGGIGRVYQELLSENFTLQKPYEAGFASDRLRKEAGQVFRGGIGRNLNRPEGIEIIRSPLEINRISFEGRLDLPK